MKITRVYTGNDQHTHFEDIEIPLKSAGDIGTLSKKYSVTGIIFRENIPNYDFDWHTAPQRQYVIMLEGEVTIQVSDGKQRTFQAGDIFLLEDTTGSGHKSWHPNNKPRRTVFVTLD